MNVFAKIFAQIFDSSIAGDYMVRHIFMDLLVLADRDGVVDMTPDAISRRTNVPEEMVLHALAELMKPDLKSRSPLESGARLVPLDSHRDWGWQIVNFDHYRAIRDEESRKTYFRDYKREYRQSKKSTKGPHLSTTVLDCPTKSTKGEGEVEEEREALKPFNSLSIDPNQMARGLCERLNLSRGMGKGTVYEAVYDLGNLEQKRGGDLEALCDRLESAYQQWMAVPDLEYRWGVAKFFAEGHWQHPDSWPRKAKSRAQEISEWSAPND